MGRAHCRTGSQKVWTGCYIGTWLMLVVGLMIYHIAITKVAPAMADLPDNLRTGFYKVFKFDSLEGDATVIKDNCRNALGLCGVQPAGCSNLQDPVPLDRKSSTNTQKGEIVNAFTRSLNRINEICNDKYFGTDAFASVATDLNKILTNVANLNTNNGPCIGTNVLYCSIYESSTAIIDGVSVVTTEIDKFIDSDIVKQYKDHAGKLVGLHALPYILVISALFFFGLWWKEGTCCCCEGGSFIPGFVCFIIPHILFWLVFFIINTIVVAVGIGLKYFSDKVQLDFFNGKPNLKQFLEHVKTTYPDFWGVVFEDLETGCDFMLNAALIFEVFCLLIPVYGCCMCICRPYREDKSCKVVDISNAEK